MELELFSILIKFSQNFGQTFTTIWKYAVLNYFLNTTRKIKGNFQFFESFHEIIF